MKKGRIRRIPTVSQPQDWWVWWFGFLALASTLGMLALLANRYEIFTRPQDGLVCNCQIVISQEAQSQFTKDLQSRLRRQQWEQLQEIITWVRPTIDEIHAVPWSAHYD